MIWIEVDGERIDVIDYSEARRLILHRFPGAVFQQPIKLDDQRIIQVRRAPRHVPSDLDLMPVAVIVEEEF